MSKLRNLALWILIALLIILLFNLFQGTGQRADVPPLTYSQFRHEVIEGEVTNVTIQGDQVSGELKNGKLFVATIPTNDQSLWATLKEHNVNVKIAPLDDGMPTLLAVLINWFPMLLLIGVLAFFLRKLRPGEMHTAVRIGELNWRRGLFRTWLVASVLWTLNLAASVWYSCQMDLCWLGPIHLPGLPQSLYAPLGSMTAWTWIVLAGEGVLAPIALFVIGWAVLWALEGYKKAE